MSLPIHKSPPRYIPCWSAGFTLIEIIMVIAIMGLLAGIAIPAFVSYSASQSLQSSTASVLSLLQLAKSNVESQYKPAGCFGSLLGYIFYINGSNYAVDAVCQSGAVCTRVNVSAKTLNGTVSFTTGNIPPMPGDCSVSPRPLLFKILHQGTILPNAGLSYPITLRRSGQNNTITVDSTGIISQQ